MFELDIIKGLAQRTLVVPSATTESNHFLWDRSQRLVRNVEYICKLPEIAKGNPQIDRFCLIIATYFSDAGLAQWLKNGNTLATKLAIFSVNQDELLDFCTQAVWEKLGSALDKIKIKKINKIITESNYSTTPMIEAMILSDARNLDDMGATGLVHEFRQHTVKGKSISNALKIWKSKADYRYWQSRLKENFRFESVRKLAEQRLATAENFMNQLYIEHTSQDFEKLLTN